MKNFIKKNLGFTLIEVLVALLLVSGTALVTTNMWSRNLLYIGGSRIYDKVAFLLDQKISELEVQYSNIEELPEIEEGDFGKEYPDFRWEMESQPFDMPDISSLLIEGAGSEGIDNTTLSLIGQVKDLIRNSVKEVKVTVFVKYKKRERSYSVVTYFTSQNVDLSSVVGAGGK